MAERKVVQLDEIKDAQSKSKRLCTSMVDTADDLKKLINIEALETNAPYLEELAQIHTGVCRDLESTSEVVARLFKAVVQDAELTVKNASSLRTVNA